MISLVPLLLVLLASLLGGLGPVFLKKGVEHVRVFLPKTWFDLRFLFGVFLYGASVLIYVVALRQTALTVLYPIVSLSYAWAAFFSHKLLGEKLNAHKITGVCLIITGTGVISLLG